MSGAETHRTSRGGVAALGFGALGIVYGDIGTSPIYAIRESFDRADLTVNVENAYGVASVVFWALIIVISIKYLALVMRADNHGEGGILALTALVSPTSGDATGALAAVVSLGVFGTALLYGDGLITPAISVLSAVEGFEVASDAFENFVIPISIVILIGLFAVQRHGTARISRVFGPVMLAWFTTLGVLGLRQVLQHPAVLRAVSPSYAVEFFVDEPARAFIALGSIFLVVTGGEALYADMGHFGRHPIQFSWYTLVLPALVLNYFGQAALLASDPSAVESPFYRLAPSWAIFPLAVLATCATVIASQALISGAFSLTAQAVRLDYLPRMRVVHTSSDHIGQIYVPVVNGLLMVGCVGLVLGFRSSSNLASAYGIAVTMTMLITTLLFYRVARDRWQWSAAHGLAVCVPMLIVDTAFFTANIPKVVTGGWFPLVVGVLLVSLMTTWRRGRQLVAERIHRGERPIESVIDAALAADVARVPGIAVYMFKDVGAAPPAMIANLEHNRVLHRLTLLVSVATTDAPRVSDEDRLTRREVGPGIQQIDLRFGFLDDPNVPQALAGVDIGGQGFDPDAATYFIGREAVTSTKAPGMWSVREHLFVALNRSASSASRFFSLPRNRVFEVGTLVEIWWRSDGGDLTVETPYYLIDERRLRENLEVVQRVRETSGAKAVLALKCFSTWGVFDLIADHLDGTTSSSLYEARLGRERFGKEVHAYSVAWSADELTEVAGLADKVIFNSVRQLQMHRARVGDRPLGLRVNPGVSHSHFDLADPARPHSRLGVTDDGELRSVVDELSGLMFHFNCENEDFDALRVAVDTIADRYAEVLHRMEWVSLGGGISFTTPGYPVGQFAEMLRRLADRFDLQIYLEPGEAVVTGSAQLVTTVLDVVHNEVDIAVVDASVEAHMLDHLIYSTHPRIDTPVAGSHAVTIAGRTCLAGDVFGEYSLEQPLHVGDEVRFADAAGYTMVKTTWFNGLRMPSIVVRRLDGDVLVVREFGYDDFERNLS